VSGPPDLRTGGNRLAGKVALITGAGGGIGRASVRRFAGEGACVIAVDREASADPELPADAPVLRLRADVTRAAEVAGAIAAGVERFGRLDVLFNVVGISGRRFGDGPVDHCTEEGWDLVLTTNLKSTYLCCHHALPRMGRGASIINLASVLGLIGEGEHFATHAYAASKGGVIALTRAMAVHYAPRGIRVNALCPGLIETPMSARAQADPEILALMGRLQPLTGALGQPLDVAHAALFLATDESAFITGAILPVDGGWTAQ
jgi:NAD(P)-dependent dehydrogenase (short-subunit alcohol dehydrogenase family)